MLKVLIKETSHFINSLEKSLGIKQVVNGNILNAFLILGVTSIKLSYCTPKALGSISPEKLCIIN